MNPSSKRALQRQSFVCTKQRASQIYYYFPQLPPEKECFTKLRWFSMLNEYTAFYRDTQYPLPWQGKPSWIIHPLLLYLKLLGFLWCLVCMFSSLSSLQFGVYSTQTFFKSHGWFSNRPSDINERHVIKEASMEKPRKKAKEQRNH